MKKSTKTKNPTDPEKVSITKTYAKRLLKTLRVFMAEGKTAKEMEAFLARSGIPALQKCEGEAHTNPQIDSCGLCGPAWGFMGADLEVR